MRSSYGNRTHDSAVRGQRLNPLTNEPFIKFAELLLNASHILSEPLDKCKHFLFIFLKLCYYSQLFHGLIGVNSWNIPKIEKKRTWE